MVRNHAEFDKDLLWAKSNVLDFAMKAGGFGLPISSERPGVRSPYSCLQE